MCGSIHDEPMICANRKGRETVCAIRISLRTAGAIAKLSEPICTPSEERTVGLDAEAVIAARLDRAPIGARADLRWRISLERPAGAKAELAKIILAPRPNRAVRFQGERVNDARADSSPVRVGADSRRDRFERTFAAESKLAVAIRAPRPDCSVRAPRETEETTRADFNPRRFRADARRHTVVRAFAAEAELAEIISAPRPQSSIALQRECMGRTGGNLEPIRFTAHAHRNDLRRRRRADTRSEE